MTKTFDEVIEFHRHLCLDITMGYRIARAAMRELGKDAGDLKDLVALVENETCAVDAIQEFTGCTLGKRNLILTGVGKPVYILLNTRTGHAVRIYCSFWETFDPDGEFTKRRRHASSPEASPEEQRAFQRELKVKIQEILRTPEEALFTVHHITMEAPPKSGKYKAQPCARCGEYTHVGRLIEVEGQKLCRDCHPVQNTQ